MRVLVFGSNGQVGRALRRRLEDNALAIGRAECDLMTPGSARAIIDAAGCDAVINAAAYTAVDKAQSERAAAHRINADAPAEMASACAARDLPFIHFSTDYVFDGGAHRPYVEEDPTGPLNVYGETKLAGERAVAAAGGAFAVIRLSWVFSPDGSNFVKTMLRLAGERESLRIVSDQRGKPTPAAGAADAGLAAARALLDDRKRAGVYHFAGDEPTTWAGFASAIFGGAGLAVRVEPIATSDYPTPARRPLYSVLDSARFEKTFGVAAPSWREALAEIVAPGAA